MAFSWLEVAVILLVFVFVLPSLGGRRRVHQLIQGVGLLGLIAVGVFLFVVAIYMIRLDPGAEQAATVEFAHEHEIIDVAPPLVEVPPPLVAEQVAAKPHTEPTEPVKTAKIETNRQPLVPRPAWVSARSELKGGDYYRTLLIGPYSSRSECENALPGELSAAATDYVRVHLGPSATECVRLPDIYLRKHVLTDQWEEPIDSSVGPMVQLHARLKFDDDTRTMVDSLWHESRVHERLAWTGGTAGGILFLLATAFGYLKADEATGGAYRRRLQAAAGGTILVLALLAALLAHGAIGL